AKSWREAREGPIKKYLEHYADRVDEPTKHMRDWADLSYREDREHQLRNRMRMKMTADDPTEQQAQFAVGAEEEGDHATAKSHWQALLKYRNDADPDARAWGLVADKHLEDIKSAESREQQLRNRIAEARRFTRAVKPDDDLERLTLVALSAEDSFEDFPLA